MERERKQKNKTLRYTQKSFKRGEIKKKKGGNNQKKPPSKYCVINISTLFTFVCLYYILKLKSQKSQKLGDFGDVTLIQNKTDYR